MGWRMGEGVGNGMGWDGMGWDGMGWDGMGWDGMGWDGMGWDGMGWDGVGWGGVFASCGCVCVSVLSLCLAHLQQTLCSGSRTKCQPLGVSVCTERSNRPYFLVAVV